jgi:hypothetical protein
MRKIMKQFLTLSSTVATHFIFQLTRSSVSLEVVTKFFDVAFTEVFMLHPIDVLGVRGKAMSTLPLSMSSCSIFLLAFPQSFIRGGVIGHGRGEDSDIVIWLVVACCLLWRAPALPMMFSH